MFPRMRLGVREVSQSPFAKRVGRPGVTRAHWEAVAAPRENSATRSVPAGSCFPKSSPLLAKTVDRGLWTLDCGLWTVPFGPLPRRHRVRANARAGRPGERPDRFRSSASAIARLSGHLFET